MLKKLLRCFVKLGYFHLVADEGGTRTQKHENTMNNAYTNPIKKISDLVALFDDLKSDDKLYHPEDSAADIFCFDDGRFGRSLIFTPEEAVALDDRMSEAYALDWNAEVFECPCDLLLTIDPPCGPNDMDEEELEAHNAKLEALEQLRANCKEGGSK